MNMLAIIIVAAAGIAAYVIWVRPYLRGLPQFSEIYRGLDEREARLWQTIKIWLDGRKTIITGLVGGFFEVGPELLAQFEASGLKDKLPDNWGLYVALATIALMSIFRAHAARSGS